MSKEELRHKILQLVEQFGEDNLIKTPFKEGDVIPSSGKVIGASELKMMTDAVLDGWLTAGRFNEKFEKKLSEYLGIKHVITTNSGSC